jgi:hypothetical protein
MASNTAKPVTAAAAAAAVCRSVEGEIDASSVEHKDSSDLVLRSSYDSNGDEGSVDFSAVNAFVEEVK